MAYFITFLEGIISFISPCVLPMLPIYISYFIGQEEQNTKGKAFKNSLGFVLGFTIVFVILGVFAGSLGIFFKEYKSIINILFGIIIILFGLSFMQMIKLPNIGKKDWKVEPQNLHFMQAILFGIIFAVSWTPCVGAFLGSALLMAATAEHVWEGIGLLICFSLGLGIPFIISSLLIEKLKNTFQWIKQHYNWIEKIAGVFLVIIGILMMTGYLDAFLKFLA